jgi:hypothetical protein
MRIGAMELLASHPAVYIGTADRPEVDCGERPVAADLAHVVVRTTGLGAATRVTLWDRAMPAEGEALFDGELALPDGRIVVMDLERLTVFGKQVGRPGRHRVVVRADDPGQASRVWVGIDLGPHRTALTGSPSYPLAPAILETDAPLDPADELGLILDEHDAPLARLAAAITVLRRQPSAPSVFDINAVGQWLRWLGPDVTRERAVALAQDMAQQLWASRTDNSVAAVEIARRGLAAI